MSLKKQNGAALAVGMILLLIITLMGYTSMKGTMLQEKMAAGVHNRTLANGGANTALRAGESFLYNIIGISNAVNVQGTDAGSLFGIYSRYATLGDPSSGPNPYVQTFMNNDWSNPLGTSMDYDYTNTASDNSNLRQNPRYLIQQLNVSSGSGNISVEFGGGPNGSNGGLGGNQKTFLITGKSQSGDGNSFALVQSLYTVVTNSGGTQ